ncbi:MAG: DUF4956 domain-containing protein [Lachnospiraceae bacterium]|nr:DUF4956 domain-containing protein [Lachnospiraceae bacterium]MBQ2100377.1 DUF4956 domain-containing protein [Lachnospiraceae bacterium]MBQ3905967.1 DUF4956 domain-containing protein [Lachnospiraceae bacterium]
MTTLFQGVFDTTSSASLQVGDFLICLGAALILGFFLAIVSSYKANTSQSFFLSIALLPAVVCVVIMMVNGNVGAGIAVAGAFSLVRFRSAPGSAKEICAIFLAMGAGLILGMGYVGYAVLFTVILSAVLFAYVQLGIGNKQSLPQEKTLHVTIPENLDYETVFEEILEKYTAKHELTNVKTTNMGSLFKLTYGITLKEIGREKEFLDKLRTRNGNLEISLSKRDKSQQIEL